MKKTRMSFRAVKLRLARALAHEDQFLRACRVGSRWYAELGRYYVVDGRNNITAKHIDVEKWAREHKVIGAEVIVEEE